MKYTLKGLVDDQGFTKKVQLYRSSIFVIDEDGKVYELGQLRDIGKPVKDGYQILILAREGWKVYKYLLLFVTSVEEKTAEVIMQKAFSLDNVASVDVSEGGVLRADESEIEWILNSFAENQKNLD